MLKNLTILPGNYDCPVPSFHQTFAGKGTTFEGCKVLSESHVTPKGVGGGAVFGKTATLHFTTQLRTLIRIRLHHWNQCIVPFFFLSAKEA